MSHLLHVTKIQSKGGPNRQPVMMEFPVSPDTAPYLVSSSKAVQWIPESRDGGVVPAGVRREVVVKDFFIEVLRAVWDMGQQAEWGNTHPLTEEGLKGALDHVGEYGLGDLSVLAPPNFEAFSIKTIAKDYGCVVQPSSWLPDDCVVVVPKDRSFVGFVGLLTASSLVSVVHNASRGLALAWGEADALVARSPVSVSVD